MQQAGWFPDPGGAPGKVRYWDGKAWTNELRDAPGTSKNSYAPMAPAPRSGPPPWVFIVVGLVVLAVLAGVGFAISRGSNPPPGREDPGPPVVRTTAAPPPETCPAASQGTESPPPVTSGRVTSGQLSFPELSAPFGAPQWDNRIPYGRQIRLQYATLERPGGKYVWGALASVSIVTAGDGFYDPKQGAELVTDCVVGLFYGDTPGPRTDVANKAISVDGHDAWQIEFTVPVSDQGLKAKAYTGIVVVVDTGPTEAGLFYGTFPDNAPKEAAAIRAALAGLQVS